MEVFFFCILAASDELACKTGFRKRPPLGLVCAYYFKKHYIFAFKYSANLKIFACDAQIRGALINLSFQKCECLGALINSTFQNSELVGGAY